MRLVGLQTYAQLRRSRRDFSAKYPRIKTRDDRDALSRMDGFVFALFLALAVIPAVALVVNHMAGGDWVRTIIASVYQWGPM